MTNQKLSLAVKNWLKKTNTTIDQGEFKVDNKWNGLRPKWTVTVARSGRQGGKTKINYRGSINDLKENKPFDIYSFLYCISSDVSTYQDYINSPGKFVEDMGYEYLEGLEVYKSLKEQYEKFISINVENELQELYQIFLDNNY